MSGKYYCQGQWKLLGHWNSNPLIRFFERGENRQLFFKLGINVKNNYIFENIKSSHQPTLIRNEFVDCSCGI